MRFRKLRIAFSATCLIACVLLIMLWVRSYWHWDILQLGRTIVLAEIDSEQGEIRFAKHLPFTDWSGNFLLLSSTVDARRANNDYFYFAMSGGNFFAGMPHWCAALMFTAIAAVPWFPWWSSRFSLRTLLIAMTLVALVLGSIAVLSH